MINQVATTSAPPFRYLVGEARAFVSQRWKSIVPPRFQGSEAGRGRPVMVIPGFMTSDRSTTVIRRALASQGYEVFGWGLGVNRGVRATLLKEAEAQLDLAARHGPVTLIGWSLGGMYAREIAKLYPDKVARVITLGSPFSGDVRANRAWRLYELVNDHKVDAPPIDARVHEKPPVPTFAMWSRRDGIVASACSRGLPEERDRAIEVDCTHIGFVSEPRALEAVLDLLAAD